MAIVGWVRVGDLADCGGKVVEGSSCDFSGGIAYSFQGAKMACERQCVITDGYPSSTLLNGKAQVLDGHRTNGGCILRSTLNGIDGVADEAR